VTDLDHPSQALLRRLFRGELDPAAARPLIRHLLGACRVCRRHVRAEAAALAGGPALAHLPAARDEDYDLALDRAFDRIALHGAALLRHQRRVRRVEALLAAGAAVPGPDGVARRGPAAALAAMEHARARGHRSGLAVYEALLARAWAVRFDDRAAAITLTELACIAAHGLGAAGHGAAQVADFEARAWGERANALRADMRLAEADLALGRAMELADRGTQDVCIQVRLLDIGASLLAYRRQRSEAINVLDGVYKGYLVLGDLNRAGSALVNRATYLGWDGRPDLAERLLAEALELIDPVHEPAVASIALHSRVWFLALAGQAREARSVLWKNREAIATFANLGVVWKARVAHLEGYINAGLGAHDRAERAFRSALEELAKHESERLLRGTIALDLAVVLSNQGRHDEACRLAADVARHLLANDVPEEAAKALHFLLRALNRRWGSSFVVEKVVEFLRRIEHVPEARFEAWRGES
jgi:tetratricopeptide (TPR) repeat protein